MNNSTHKGPIDKGFPDFYTKGIKHYVEHAVSDLEERFRQDTELNIDYGIIRCLKLFDPLDIHTHSSQTILLTGDPDGSRALFMKILKTIGSERKQHTTVIVPQGEGVDIANSLISQEAKVDIVSDRRAWTDDKYISSFVKDFAAVAHSKIEIVDAPSLYCSIAFASNLNNLKCLCVAGFPGNYPDEELNTLKGFSAGRNIPVIVLNDGVPIDHKQLWELIDTCYHMETVKDLEYLLTVESKRLKAKEEAEVMLNPTRRWITSMESKSVIKTRLDS